MVEIIVVKIAALLSARTVGRGLPPLVPIAVFLLATFLLVTVPAAQAATVTYLVKPAQVKRKGTRDWVSLNMGDAVREGDSVRTGTGARVELSITKKRQFRIGQATEILLEGLDEKRPSLGLRASVKLLLGRFWGSIRTPLRGAFGERVRVSTATATIGIKGTTFGVDFDKKSGATRVAVVTGQVGVQPPEKPGGPPTQITGPREIAPPQEISREEWTRLVGADQKLIIRPGEVPRTEPLTEEDKQDAWLAFNIARDQQ